MGGGSALCIGSNPMPSVTILDSLKAVFFYGENMEYKSFLKTVGGGEGQKCHYPTRLDVYGCGCEHNCAYCYARSLLDFRGLWGKPRTADIEAVKRAVRRLKAGSIVRMGGMTDCFAPIERRKGLALATIEELNDRGIGYLIVTKSDLVADYIPVRGFNSKEITVCEDVDEHYRFWRDNFNPNPSDCCNLRKDGEHGKTVFKDEAVRPCAV